MWPPMPEHRRRRRSSSNSDSVARQHPSQRASERAREREREREGRATSDCYFGRQSLRWRSRLESTTASRFIIACIHYATSSVPTTPHSLLSSPHPHPFLSFSPFLRLNESNNSQNCDHTHPLRNTDCVHVTGPPTPCPCSIFLSRLAVKLYCIVLTQVNRIKIINKQRELISARKTSHEHNNQDRKTSHEHNNQDRKTSHEHNNQDRKTSHGHNNQDRKTSHGHNNQDRKTSHEHNNQDPSRLL